MSLDVADHELNAESIDKVGFRRLRHDASQSESSGVQKVLRYKDGIIKETRGSGRL